MASKAVIDSVDQTANLRLESGITINLGLNNRARASFTCREGYLPDRFDTVDLYAQDGTTKLFGGFILQRRPSGAAYGAGPMFTECECVGLAAYLDWYVLTLAWATDPTLQDILDDLVAALPAAYGITLDATDYSGTTLAAFSLTNVRASDALRDICGRIPGGMVYTVSPAGVLSLAALGGTAATYSLTDGAPHCREVTWEDPTEPPVTTIKLLCGTGTATHNQVWTAAGGETAFVADVPAAGEFGYWTANVFIAGDPTPYYCTVGPGAMFEWNWLTRTLTKGTVEAIIGTITAGSTVSFPYVAQFPFTVTSTTGGTPDVVRIYERPDVFEVAAGQEIADGLKAQLSAAGRTLTIDSLDLGWLPGQEVTIDLTDRAIDAVCAITDVEIRLEGDTAWAYTLKATELSLYDGGYLAAWRELLGGSSSGAGSVVTSVSGGGSGGTTIVTSNTPNLYEYSYTYGDAAIKALPTTGVQVLPAPGAGCIWAVLLVSVIVDARDGVYAGFDDGCYLELSHKYSDNLADDAAGGLTEITDLFGTAGIQHGTLRGRFSTEADSTGLAFAGWGQRVKVIQDAYDDENAAVTLQIAGNAADFTGGNSTNRMHLRVLALKIGLAGGGGYVPPPTPYRYWRVFIQGNPVNDYFRAAEVQFRETEGGADAATGGSAICSTELGGSYAASKAFDDDAATQWASADSYDGTDGYEWIGYDFGAGNEKAIVEIAITSPSSGNYTKYANFDLHASNDGSAWVVVARFRNQVEFNANNQTKVYQVSAASVDYDAAVHVLKAASVNPWTASASSEVSGYEAWHAFGVASGVDDRWSADATTGWLQFDLGSGHSELVATYGILASGAGDATRLPKNWTLKGSADGASWTTLDTRTNETGWGTSELRTYTVASPGSYRYYRLDITANNGHASYVQVGELYLWVGAYP